MAQYVKQVVSEDTTKKIADFLGKVVKGGKIKIGVNEVTKAVERSSAKLVVMAEDVTPEELLYHIPVLCTEKKIPFTYIKEKKELGKLAGLSVSASSIAVINEGTAKKELDSLVNALKELAK